MKIDCCGILLHWAKIYVPLSALCPALTFYKNSVPTVIPEGIKLRLHSPNTTSINLGNIGKEMGYYHPRLYLRTYQRKF